MRVRGFALLVAGQFASGVGDLCFAVALPWLILSEHGGPAELGVVVGCYGLTRALGIPAGGYLADHVDPRRVMIVVDTTRLVLTGVLGGLAVAGHPGMPVLVPFALLHGGCGGAFLPASRSIMPSVLPEDQLIAGNAMYTVITQAGSLLGPAVGGILVALAGSGPALLTDAGTFAVSAITLLAIRRPAPPFGATEAQQTPGAQADSDSPTFATVLRHGRLLHAFLAAAFLLNLFLAGTTEVALPTLAHQYFGAGGYGALLAALAVGAIVGGFVARIPWWPDRPTFRMSAVTVIMGVALGMLPFAGGLVGAVICMALVGVGDAASGVDVVSMLQVWAPRPVLGRVMSTIMFGVMGLFPVSVLISGVLVRHLGPRDFFPVAGAVILLAILVALASPAFRNYRAGDRFIAPDRATPGPPPGTEDTVTSEA